jgi:NAD+ diphosphatase
VSAGPGPAVSGSLPPAPAAGQPAAPGRGRAGLGLTGTALTGLALARGDVDRAASRRTDQAWLDAAWADPRTRVLPVQHGRALCQIDEAGARLVFVGTAAAPDGVRFLLGTDASGTAYFGVAGQVPQPPEPAAGRESGPGPEPDGASLRVAHLREVGPLLSDRDAGLMTQAVALANWHETFTHCPRCGSPTEPIYSGHARRCPVDASEHFPRVDPAMIVLVTDPDDRCLLARNALWPERRVSILAGFVEAGESAEQAVAREVHEETSVVVAAVRYLGSQPWPMPQSLMLGFRAEADGRQEIHVDAEEIAEASWYSRDDLSAAIAEGRLLLPPPVSIAHHIIASWYGADLPGSW